MHPADGEPAKKLPRSALMHAAAGEVLPGGTSRSVHQGQPHPIYAASGRGCVVTDVDGNRYVDFYNNATSLIHGHAHPPTVSAITVQARRGTAFALPVESQIALARLLRDRIGGVDQVRFVNSGSEAVLLALQVARAVTGRPAIAKFEGLYHGSAEAAEVSLDPDPDAWGSPSAPASVAYTRGTPAGLLENVVVLPFNDIEATEAGLRANAGRLAAVLLDVMPMRLGFIAADRDWVAAVRRLTRELGILLVADEVVTFRLEAGGGQAVHGYSADLTILGKIIGGGLPVGAVAGPRDIMHAFDDSGGRALVPNAGTFNANPLTMAAGLAAMRAYGPAEINRINQLGGTLRARLDAGLTELHAAAHVTGAGSLFGIHMTDRRYRDYRSYWRTQVADGDARRRQRMLHDDLRQRGFLLTTAGVGALSTAMSEGEVDAFVAAVMETVQRMGAMSSPAAHGSAPGTSAV